MPRPTSDYSWSQRAIPAVTRHAKRAQNYPACAGRSVPSPANETVLPDSARRYVFVLHPGVILMTVTRDILLHARLFSSSLSGHRQLSPRTGACLNISILGAGPGEEAGSTLRSCSLADVLQVNHPFIDPRTISTQRFNRGRSPFIVYTSRKINSRFKSRAASNVALASAFSKSQSNISPEM